jgi:PEP-CTERM motif
MKLYARHAIAGLAVGAAAIIGSVNVAAAAANNDPPPPGAILDLAALADNTIPHAAPQQYTVDFFAGLSSTTISLAFREDPAFFAVTNVSVVDLTASSGNLLLNGDFSGPSPGGLPADWSFQNVFGATFSGVVQPSCSIVASGPGPCWFDGSVQAYDELSQTIATTIGHQYEVSFWNVDNGPLTNYSALSTNGNTTNTGGNGADILVYATATAPPLNTPEPATWAMMLIGFAGLGFAGYRARRSQALAG